MTARNPQVRADTVSVKSDLSPVVDGLVRGRYDDCANDRDGTVKRHIPGYMHSTASWKHVLCHLLEGADR